MNEKQAEQVAKLFEGDSYNTGGGLYVVIVTTEAGKTVVINLECVCEYDSLQDWENQNTEDNFIQFV